MPSESVDPQALNHDLERRIQAYEDRQAIHDALMRYCRGVDRGIPELILSAFHDDAIDNHFGIPLPPREAIGGLRNPGGGPRQSHNICNEYVELHGNVAISESYFIMLVRLPREGKDLDWFLSGRYIDRFERRNGDWRIAMRTVVYDMERFDESITGDDSLGMMSSQSKAVRGARGAEDWSVKAFASAR